VLEISFSRKADKFLRDLKFGQPKHVRQLAQKILDLRKQPYPNDSKQLKGYPYHRVDSGEYRIVYRVEGELLVIALVGKRNDDEVYRNL
jgi:mRNA interferase RelE/StbE